MTREKYYMTSKSDVVLDSIMSYCKKNNDGQFLKKHKGYIIFNFKGDADKLAKYKKIIMLNNIEEYFIHHTSILIYT
jgi:hypothetical protein